ncbi:MAG: RagB/SusD family nutrient uptake outer membrane protein [Bacteroidales bacterium]
MKKIIYSLIIATFIFGNSCETSIHDMPVDYYDIDDVMSDSIYVIGLVNDMYAALPDGYNRLDGNSMIASTTDEAVASGNYTEAEFMATGAWSASSPRDDAWSSSYAAIRKTNIFLNDLHPQVPEGLFVSDRTIELLLGQTYFLRAFFYFELVKRYGGVPIITEVLEIGEGAGMERDSYEDCIQFIVDECDNAAAILPDIWQSNATNFGRATKGAALALKSRTLLYAASPLFNDPLNSESTVEHGAYDAGKWQDAAQAAYDVINLNTYQLFNDYEGFFTTLSGNDEIIFSKMTSRNNDVERLNGPTGFTDGMGGSCPSLDLVDAYKMSDGSLFDWDNPVHAENPFQDREPRFYASVLYNGASWMGSTIETFQGGKDLGNVNSTKTGFYLKKFMSEDAQWFGGSSGATYHCFPHIRYAEILLNFAEAMNEAYGPETEESFGMSALSAVNEVRNRVQLPPLPTGLTQEEMRAIIQEERRIELAFEEHRHLDLRRWKLAGTVLGQPVNGLKITAINDSTFTYEPKVAQSRVFRPEMNLYPLPQSEINRNSSLQQNAGW